MIRILHFTKGLTERIVITQDLGIIADDFVPKGFDLESDTTLDGSLPITFPLDSEFEKK